MNRAAYEKLIADDIDWLRKVPRTLERDHILQVLSQAIEYEYGPTGEAAAAQREELKRREDRLSLLEAEVAGLHAELERSELICRAAAEYREAETHKNEDVSAWLRHVRQKADVLDAALSYFGRRSESSAPMFRKNRNLG